MPAPQDSLDGLLEVIAHHWGYRSLRPLQEPAMRAVLDRRDSLVVLPTGGGKSLCYQAPAVFRGGTTVVISPLIALMKDQVDALQRIGVAAVQLDSSQSEQERFSYGIDVREGALRLVFVSPERLVNADFCRLLKEAKVHSFAIDEAHCISHWGHDFRPAYRQLSRLREMFPEASIHGYTATATEPVRRDIVEQLGLRDPVVLVGNFDRPNLTYRVFPRLDVVSQVEEVFARHRNEPGIVYCFRKADVDTLAATLRARGHNVVPYHAGMSTDDRRASQEAFISERVNVVVATIAFGMGIDRSNVRFVLHTYLPKSLEHYQQETGRAGRDGLEAECVILYSGGDVVTLKRLILKSGDDPDVDPAWLPSMLKHLEDMNRYCRGAVCRHKALVKYFGQQYEAPSCKACDICLGDTAEVPEATVLAQKILSCVARVKEGFGVNHVIAVLRGENTEAVHMRGHDQLTTHGLLKEHTKTELRDWIYQLIGHGLLFQVGEDYPILKLNDASWEVMRGKRRAHLVQPIRAKQGEKREVSRAATVSWEGVDEGLFEDLRQLRRDLAQEQQVPPYVIFNDAVLRELARIRPSSAERMRQISGVGDVKLRTYGDVFLKAVASWCERTGLARDVTPPRPTSAPSLPLPPIGPPKLSPRQHTAFARFREGAVVEDVMHELSLSRSTVVDYLTLFLRHERPATLAPWVSEDVYQRVAAAARQVGTDRLKPIYLQLGEQVPYDMIRLVLAHLQAPPTSVGGH